LEIELTIVLNSTHLHNITSNAETLYSVLKLKSQLKLYKASASQW